MWPSLCCHGIEHTAKEMHKRDILWMEGEHITKASLISNQIQTRILLLIQSNPHN